MAEEVRIVIKAVDGTSQSLGDIQRRFGGLGSTLSQVGQIAGGIALGGIAVATGAMVGLGLAIKDATEFAIVQQDVEQQLQATLASTGEVAGLTFAELTKMASGLQEVTRFGDEAIIPAQSLLLTFTNIGKDVFPEALERVLDVSTALGQDLRTSAIQVGKALNDPIAGIGALGRAGIQFTEDQKELIEGFVEQGEVVKAQQIILNELSTQFEGSARAAAETFSGRLEQLQNVIGDVKEEIGFAFLPVLTELAEEAVPLVINEILPLVREILPDLARFVTNAARIFADFGRELVNTIIPAVELINQTLQDAGFETDAATLALDAFKAVLDAVITGIKLGAIVIAGWIKIIAAVRDIIREAKAQVKDFVQAVKSIPTTVAGVALSAIIPGFQHGADFIVPPGFENDRFLFRASSGERVTVQPNVTNNFNATFNSPVSSAGLMRDFEFMKSMVTV